MTFKGMLKILINDYRKQHEEKMYSIVQELMKTRSELRDVKDQLHGLQLSDTAAPPPGNSDILAQTISLFVQYNGFFNQLCTIRRTMTIEKLLVKLRQLTGIPIERPIRLRILSEDGSTTLFFLHKEPNRTLESYNDCLKDGMIISIEDSDDDNHQEKPFERSKRLNTSKQTYSYDESDV